MWLHFLKVAQLLRSGACLHTNQSRSYLNHPVYYYGYTTSWRRMFIDGEGGTYAHAHCTVTEHFPPLPHVTQTLFLWGFVPRVLQVSGLIFSGRSVGYVSFRSTFLELLPSRGVPIMHLVLTCSPVFARHTVCCTVDERYSTLLDPSSCHPCALYRTYLCFNLILFLNLQIDQFPEIESYGTIFQRVSFSY